eukprot:TRINITY_DN1508_c0_g1_i1.p2 TRINITY_DN1508_c0_g1~~TRINITY_DN1508_c0_g1_i1.p2  ORF type:complete len:328 (+),score=131.09 TRINITY_DN1508_c0_g1_i1:604-1587(+)
MDAGTCTSRLCDAMGLCMSVLQLGQFIPQHVEMYREKSTVGISAWLLFFGGLYTWLAALDIVITGAGNAFTCGASPYRCFVSNQPLLQMVGSAVLSIGMWYWFLLYQHRADDVAADNANVEEGNTYNYGSTGGGGGGSLAIANGSTGAAGADDAAETHWSDFDGTQCFNVLAVLVAFSAVAAAAVVSFGTSAQAVAFAHVCGYMAGALNAVMWLPQIASTWAYQHKGALSLYWVLFSALADVIYTSYLIFMGLDMSVWVNNVPDGIQTTILFGLITYFSWRDRRAGCDDFGHPLHYAADGDVEHVEAARLLLGKAAHHDDEYQHIEA